MKKVILSVIAVFSLLAPTLLFTTSANACGVKLPETLLSLYRHSDAIHTARFTGLEESSKAAKETDEEYSEVSTRKHFDIAKTLKGKAVEKFTLVETYREYKRADAGFETMEQVDRAQVVPEITVGEEEYEDEEDVSVELKPGDRVLLFLTKNEEGPGQRLTDYSDGLKILSAEDMSVYEARIKELGPILAAEKPNPDKIVDWLVRCAEDPATRWEGTYELQRSFQALEYKAKYDAERRQKIADGETPEEDDGYFDESLDSGRTIVFATSLNEYQKQTLANILLNGEFPATAKAAGQTVRGDSELIALVSRWADSRIATLLLNRIRSGSNSAEENAELMTNVASILKDKTLTAMAEEYSKTSYEEDEAEVAEEDSEENAKTASVGERPVVTKGDRSEPTTREAEVEDTDPSDAEPAAAKSVVVVKKKASVLTYKHFRADSIAKFVLRADDVITNPDAHALSLKATQSR